MSRFKKNLLSILLLICLTLFVYSTTFKNSFVYDDYPYVVENTAIRNLDIRSLISAFRDRDSLSANKVLSGNSWRPLATISFAVDYSLWKLNPRFYHMENVILHCLNVVLVYLLAVMILGSPLAAFIASLIFAIHPAQTETVTWISGRSNLLFLLFFLAALIFHIRNRTSARSKLNYSLSLIAFTCSLLSKEMAITLPLILILYDLHFSVRKGLKEYINYYSPFFLIAASYILTRYSVLAAIAHREVWAVGNIPGNVSIVIKAVTGYMRILLMPTNLRIEYLISMPRSIIDADLLFAIFAFSLIAVVWVLFRKQKTLLFCLGWFFIALIPVYNMIPLKVMMAERFLYLPSIAFALLAGAFLSIVYHKFKKNALVTMILFFLTALIFVLYGVSSILRNREWKDEISLYKNEVLRSPVSPTSHYLLGFAYAKEAQKIILKDRSDSCCKLAIEQFEEAIRLQPTLQIAYVALANTYISIGLYDPAISNFKKAIALGEDSDIYNNLSIAYCRKGSYDKAIAACKRAICLAPANTYSYINLGNAYFAEHNYAKARRAWIRGARLGGTVPSVIQNIKNLPRR